MLSIKECEKEVLKWGVKRMKIAVKFTGNTGFQGLPFGGAKVRHFTL